MPPSDRAFVVVVPVKPPALGKTRLAPLGGNVRRELAHAIALDTVAAVVACPPVHHVLVTTDDAAFADDCRLLGARVLPDGTGGDLNPTLVQAAHEASRLAPGLAVAALCADLPSLRPEDLASVLADAPALGTAYVPDTAGTGTTLYLADDLRDFRPRFGRGSAAAHHAEGATAIGLEVPRMRADVDSPADVARAAALGVGPRTSAVLATLAR